MELGTKRLVLRSGTPRSWILRAVASAVPGGSARWKSPDRDEGGFSWAIAFVPFGTQSFRPVTGGFAPGYAPVSFQDANTCRPDLAFGHQPHGSPITTGQTGSKRDNLGQNGTELGRTGQAPKIVSDCK